MDDLLKHGVEELAGMLQRSSTTKAAFEAITLAIKEISEFIKEQNKRVAGGLRKLRVSELV